ncbi:MAG TPA: hypothetical protein VE088_07220 [Gaiellaceae bacterium]|nr:hypothetical protein [Gaiellaceae bacterium]
MFALVLAYVVIISFKLQRLEREVDALAGRAPAANEEEAPREPAPVG